MLNIPANRVMFLLRSRGLMLPGTGTTTPFTLAAHESPQMRTFLISYDLAKPSMNQPYLAEAIMSLGTAWARPLANVWYLKAEETSSEITLAEIEARLSRLLDEDDGLLVQETRGDALMLNTGLRWFRQRRRTAIDIDNVVLFPAPIAANGAANGVANGVANMAANDRPEFAPLDIRVAS